MLGGKDLPLDVNDAGIPGLVTLDDPRGGKRRRGPENQIIYDGDIAMMGKNQQRLPISARQFRSSGIQRSGRRLMSETDQVFSEQGQSKLT